jgi:RND superfamily putative drug exporter
MGFNFVLGPAGAIGIICGLVAMVTLLPVLLVVLGRWVFWPRIPRPGDLRPANESFWSRLGARIARHPRLVWAGSALVLAALACGRIGIRTGLDGSHQVVGHPGSIAGQQALAEHFHADRVDYNIFLVSRIRQAAAEEGHRAGVLTGLTVTGGVITSAGAVLAATFLALTRAPQVAFIEIGLLVAIGVLIDTFVVRSVLVPALALDAGDSFWWPGRTYKGTVRARITS